MRKLLAASLALAALPMPVGDALASEGGASATDGGDLNLVPLDEIAVPIVDADRLDGLMRVKLILQGKDAEAKAKITARVPVLRQAAVTAALEFARLDAAALRPVNAVSLNAALTVALQKAEPGVGRVLMVEVAAIRG